MTPILGLLQISGPNSDDLAQSSYRVCTSREEPTLHQDSPARVLCCCRPGPQDAIARYPRLTQTPSDGPRTSAPSSRRGAVSLPSDAARPGPCWGHRRPSWRHSLPSGRRCSPGCPDADRTRNLARCSFPCCGGFTHPPPPSPSSLSWPANKPAVWPASLAREQGLSTGAASPSAIGHILSAEAAAPPSARPAATVFACQ